MISFSGDPTLTSIDIEELLLPIRGSNISGSIFLDVSAGIQKVSKNFGPYQEIDNHLLTSNEKSKLS